MKRSFLLLLSCGIAAAMDADYLGVDTHVSNQLVLSAGLPVGVLDGEIPTPHPVVGTLTHELDSTWQPGLALGLAWQRTTWNGDGDGWHFELGVSGENWNGRLRSDSIGGVASDARETVAINAGMVTLAVGPTWRWDGPDVRIAPRLWQLDLAPVIGVGAARAQLGGGAWSDPGLVWSAGARFRLSREIGSHWRVGAQLGAAYAETTVKWQNTGDARFSAFGPTAGLVLMFGG